MNTSSAQASSSQQSLKPSFSLLSGDGIQVTTANFRATEVGADGAPPGKIRVSFDVAVTNLFQTVRFVTPTFPAVPAGLTGIVVIPYSTNVTTTTGGVGPDSANVAVVELPNHGEVTPSPQWNGTGTPPYDGTPISFFNDTDCAGGGPTPSDCSRYTVFAAPLGPRTTTGVRTVGFDIDPTVATFRARLLVAADLENTVLAPGHRVRVIEQPAADTIDAVLTAPLVLEFLDGDGEAHPGVPVFLNGGVFFPGGMPEMLVARAGTTDPAQFGGGLLDTTDALGRVRVQIRLGRRTPRSRLMAGELTIAPDTVKLAILPGNAVGVRMLSRDTTVYVDHTLQLRAGTVDRYDNLRGDPVSYIPGPTVSVTGAGVVTPSQYARTWVVASAAGGRDTGFISVVPHGQALAVSGFEGSNRILHFELDGSLFDTVPQIQVRRDAEVAWAPRGSRVPPGTDFVYSTFSLTQDAGGELFLADLAGNARRVFPQGTFRNAGYPRFWTGAWIYFSGEQQVETFSVWRVRPDGSGAERLTTTALPVAWRADPSPDGTRLVFTTFASEIGSFWGVQGLDLATRQTSSWKLPGLTGRWSPLGDRIATMPDGSGALIVADTAGGNVRAIDGAPIGAFDWSPDGQWLIVADGLRLNLVRIDDGLVLPLAWARILGQPSWQP